MEVMHFGTALEADIVPQHVRYGKACNGTTVVCQISALERAGQ
jgi:hypothetical protein